MIRHLLYVSILFWIAQSFALANFAVHNLSSKPATPITQNNQADSNRIYLEQARNKYQRQIKEQQELIRFIDREMHSFTVQNDIPMHAIDSILQLSVQTRQQQKHIAVPGDFQSAYTFQLFTIRGVESFYFSKFQHTIKKTDYHGSIPDIFTSKDLLNANNLLQEDVNTLTKELKQIENLLKDEEEYAAFVEFCKQERSQYKLDQINYQEYFRKYLHAKKRGN